MALMSAALPVVGYYIDIIEEEQCRLQQYISPVTNSSICIGWDSLNICVMNDENSLVV